MGDVLEVTECGKRHARSRRKVVGIGDEGRDVFVRELSFVDGGVGCAIWDGAIILARWIEEHAEDFADRVVVELGAGVGLPSIVAARTARRVVATDYVQSLLDNLVYNAWMNGRPLEDEDDLADVYGSADCPAARLRQQLGPKVKRALRVAYLDWADPCSPTPYEGHTLFAPVGADDWMERDLSQYFQKVDFVIGSEIIYLDREYTELADLLALLLRPGGEAVFVLSTDRAGQRGWQELVRSRGFHLAVEPVPQRLLGDYGTHQREEKYLLYRQRRPASDCQ